MERLEERNRSIGIYENGTEGIMKAALLRSFDAFLRRNE